jgi:HTH-type transcriptional regulator/antitoxin HigA
MSQRELADRTSKSEKFVSQLINAKASLTADTAHDLELVTGVSADTWLRIEGSYRAMLRRREAVAAASAADSPVEAALLKFLRDAGIVTAPARAKGEQLVQVFGLLGVSSADGLARLTRRHAAAFRVSTSFTPDAVATEVLMCLAQDQADLVPMPAYNESRLREALPHLRALTVRGPAEAAAAAREELAECGIALVFVPSVPNAHCHGVTMWRGDRVIVALSDRGKSEDHFWFTLFHELAHVLAGKRDEIYLEGPDDGEKPSWEIEADAFAAETLIPAAAATRLHAVVSLQDAAELAAELGVSPAIVVGRLQRLGLKAFSWGNGLKRPLKFAWSRDDA